MDELLGTGERGRWEGKGDENHAQSAGRSEQERLQWTTGKIPSCLLVPHAFFQHRMQIKNTVRMAYALAIAKSAPLGYAHLIDAIEANEDFDDDFRGGGGKSDAMNSYQ